MSGRKANNPDKIIQVRKWHQSERGKMMDKRRRLLRKEKIRAKNILNYLIEIGLIKRQPCAICGEVNSQGHHPDYSTPLGVIRLCQKHHSEEHRKLRLLTQLNKEEKDDKQKHGIPR